MNDALASAINAVQRERAGEFNEAFDAAVHLVAEYGAHDLANRVLAEVPISIPWEIVADLLSILEWSTEDNGASIRHQAEQWLIDANDTRKIQVALHLDVYPFEKFEHMKQVLEKLAFAQPAVAVRCEELIRQRSAQERE